MILYKLINGSMAKSIERIKSRNLRKNGFSIKEIAKKTNVSKSTVSRWCNDIELTKEQIQKLDKNQTLGAYRGRLIGARIQLEKRLKIISDFKKLGKKEIGNLSYRDFLIAGLSLYLGEGDKKRNQIQFTNSDPKIIKFMIKWFKLIMGVSQDRFTLNVLINELHKNRAKNILSFWSDVTGVSDNQFNKTVFIKSKSKKIYENSDRYFGTLAIRVKKSSQIQYKILGLMDGLLRSGYKS